MKKLIMFVMCFVLCSVAVADDLNPPDWAGAPGTIYGVWGFPVDAPSGDAGWPNDYPEEGEMVPHDTNPDPEEMTETSDTEGAHRYMINLWAGGEEGEEEEAVWHDEHNDYPGRQGILEVMMVSFDAYNFVGDGTKLIRLQVTWAGTKPPELGWGWGPPDDEDYGAWDDFVVNEIVIDEDWTHTTLEVEIDSNPEEEFIEFGFDSITYVDQVVIDTICYTGDLPDRPGRVVDREPAIAVDSNDIPVYEPQDTGGPAPGGPTDGQLQVSLAWQPSAMHDGEPNYIDFTAMVVVDPNTEGDGPNEDFTFAGGDPNGSVTLTFTEADWDDYQNVYVVATKDFYREGDESYDVELTVTIDIADPNFGNPTPVVVAGSVGVVDNDIPYIAVLPPGHLMDVLTENDPCGVPVCVNVTLSHLPTDDVYVLVARESDYDVLLESMSVMDPPLGVTDDPNKLKFIPGSYNTPQQICLEARDDPCTAEPWLEWVPGTILFSGFSDDIRYQSEEEDGELEATEVDFNVQDNECGAIGYARMDFNEDCSVGLGDFVHFYTQWLICTEPYDDDEVCDKLWNLEGEEEEE